MADITRNTLGLIRGTPFRIGAISGIGNAKGEFWVLGNKEYFVLNDSVLLSRNVGGKFDLYDYNSKITLGKINDLINYTNNNVNIHDTSFKNVSYNQIDGLFTPRGEPRNIFDPTKNREADRTELQNASGNLSNALISKKARIDLLTNKPLNGVYRATDNNTPTPNKPPSGTNPPSDPLPGNQDPAEDPQGSSTAKNDQPPLDYKEWNTLQIDWAKGAKPKDDFGTLVYPSNLDSTGQDYIVFTILEYKKRNIGISSTAVGFEKRPKGKALGNIILPIQSGISDNNSVNWRDDQINATELGFIGASLSLQTTADVSALIDGLMKEMAEDESGKIAAFKTAIINWFARKASNQNANADTFLSRITGAVLNNNIEMLFTGPSLRPFNYKFLLVARSAEEGATIRRIIRNFKEASAVQRGIGDIFLKAPYVFDISYKFGKTGETHPKINRIKTCALQSVDVNYIPDGTYMTRPDGTMTAYELSLQFTELEPVYADDYQNVLNSYGIRPNEIGF